MIKGCPGLRFKIVGRGGFIYFRAMKYWFLYIKLHVSAEDSQQVCNAVSALLGTEPTSFNPAKLGKTPYQLPHIPAIWSYKVIDKTDYFDFINHCLDLLEGKYEQLATLGAARNDILIWLNYEYQHQCAMEFSPQEMKRLGENGVHLNIDCFDRTNSPGSSHRA